MSEVCTVIIPCRNGEATISRAVVSAVEAGADFVMIYDDASTDHTRDILCELSKQYVEVEWYSELRQVRAGVNFARNFLISIAENGLIIPLDCDDSLRSIAPLVEAWQPGVWVYGDYLEHDGMTVTRIKGSRPGSLGRKEITGVTFAFHKDDWLKCGGYDPDFAYAEDYGLQCALVNAGVKPKQIDCIVYDRFLKPEGNERTVLAGQYWQFYRDMARRKYPAAFNGIG